jgi:hypothetical protein
MTAEEYRALSPDLRQELDDWLEKQGYPPVIGSQGETKGDDDGEEWYQGIFPFQKDMTAVGERYWFGAVRGKSGRTSMVWVLARRDASLLMEPIFPQFSSPPLSDAASESSLEADDTSEVL